MLVIALPHQSSQAQLGYSHVFSDGFKALRTGQAAASVLSKHSGSVVGVIPITRMSWLAIDLPPLGKTSRLNAVVHSLLEDRLLDETAQLHIVLPPTVSTQGGRVVVAVCDKAWLREVLAPLQAAGIRVQRLVSELCPSEPSQLHVMGTPQQSLSVLTHAQGVKLLPPHPEQWSGLGVNLESLPAIYAEPAMTERVQSLLQQEPRLETSSQRWIAASQSAWDLAQGEWAQGRAQRLLRDIQKLTQDFVHAPAWRPIRWGAGILLLVQLLGLNVLAWHENKLTQERQQQLKEVLISTFPSIHLVVDAPLQMKRETAKLQQSVGAITGHDLEFMLNALASGLPESAALTNFDYSAGSLKIKDLRLSNLQKLSLQKALQAKHLQLERSPDGAWLVQSGVAP